MADDIPAGEPQLSVPKQVHRFVAERRERGKSSEDSNDERATGFV